jgi:hypothetical protein
VWDHEQRKIIFFLFCGGMEWLAKATDLLDKVDQLAAERLGTMRTRKLRTMT